jgi:hypothetical protein
MAFMIFITALSSNRLSVLFEVELDVHREVPEHFVFDYTGTLIGLYFVGGWILGLIKIFL